MNVPRDRAPAGLGRGLSVGGNKHHASVNLVRTRAQEGAGTGAPPADGRERRTGAPTQVASHNPSRNRYEGRIPTRQAFAGPGGKRMPNGTLTLPVNPVLACVAYLSASTIEAIDKGVVMAFRWTGAGGARHGRSVLAFVVMIMGWLAGGPAFAATAIQSVAAVGDQIVIRFDGPIGDATGAVVGGTRQIVVDVAGALPGAAATVGGSIAAVRQEQDARGTKVIFDLSAPTVIGDGGFDPDGRALTLQLRRVDDRQFAKASAAGPIDFFPFNIGSWGTRPKYKVVQSVPAPIRAMPLPQVRGDDSRPLVVIDAGHGGFDPGAINPVTGLREKDVTLKIAKAIRVALLASGRVRVALTRSDDRYLVLRERYGIARRLHADLFISIHCDSTLSPDATGASAYTLSEVSSDKEAARLAARENKADVIAGVDLDEANPDVSSILIDLTQRETMNASAGFARLLGREARPMIPTKANFHRMASLMVLKAPDMPSILFETGYLSNPGDAAFLDSAAGEERIATSVTRAVETHFARQMASR